METFIYKPNGVCSREMHITYDGDTLIDLQVIGGCNGNLKAVSKLVEGEKVDDVIKKLSGIKCGFRDTSCADQLSKALERVKTKSE